MTTRNIGLTLEDLAYAKYFNPSGVSRLAKFVGASGEDATSVTEACEKQRREQKLENPIRLAVKIRDTRAK